MNNRKLRRILEKKLGEDFPLAEFLALLGYYNKVQHLDANSFMVYLLKTYVPEHYNKMLPYLENSSEVDNNEL